MIRYILFTLVMAIAPLGFSQVNVDQKIRLTGPDQEKRITGLALPVENSAAVSVEASVAGYAHWSEATLNGQTLMLDQPVDAEVLRNGMLLRFICPSDVSGNLNIDLQGLNDPRPLLRTDGMVPAPGHLKTGSVIEIVLLEDRWVILAPAPRGCPTGSIALRQDLCMDISPGPTGLVYAAMDQCQAKGGKLCTWDEYYVGCALFSDQLTGLFTEWEWLDDTSNHSHTADQVGRFTCMSQRSANPVMTQGKGRCCYHIR